MPAHSLEQQTASHRLRSGIALPPGVGPRVRSPRPGIVHIGLGAFFRAHQAVYTEDAMAAAGGDWGIVAVAPRSATVADAVNAQDGLFSVTSLSAAAPVTRVVGSLACALHLPTQAAQILALLADPAVRVVTLTMTEKAYQIDAAGRLVPDTGLRDDLAAPVGSDVAPTTALGLLVRGLRLRAAAGGAPLAVVSCDNLPSNGERLRSALGQALGADPGPWVSFPRTMVDRIVPASTAATYERALATLGVADLAAVDAEPFSQWVIEDDPSTVDAGGTSAFFPGGRPAWQAAGATFSGAVHEYERLKLRMLNGVHSTLAYLGAVAGAGTIEQALALTGMAEFIERLMAVDIVPTVVAPDGLSAADYGRGVLGRFANPAIGHRTIQVAMDGSQKLPQRILGTVADRRTVGELPGFLATSVAAWVRFLGGVADDASPLPLNDPLADPLRAALAGAGDDPRSQVRAVLGVRTIAPAALVEDDAFVELVAERLVQLRCDGVVATVRSLTAAV